MKKITLLLLISIFVLASCSKKESNDIHNVQKKIANMKSYSAVADMTVYGNKETSKYKVKQYWMTPGKLKIETMEPDFLKGKVMIYDGTKWSIYHPLINQSYELKKLNTQDYLIFVGVIQCGILAGEDTKYKVVTKNGKEYVEAKCQLPGGNEYRSTVAFYVSRDEYCPEILEIYDDKEKLQVSVQYSDFEYNDELKNSIFQLH